DRAENRADGHARPHGPAAWGLGRGRSALRRTPTPARHAARRHRLKISQRAGGINPFADPVIPVPPDTARRVIEDSCDDSRPPEKMMSGATRVLTRIEDSCGADVCQLVASSALGVGFSWPA